MPPEIPDVVGATPIEADWGNPIRSRTVQRYADAATRASEDPTPEAGAVSYVADRGRIEYYHGGAWRALFPPGIIMPFGGTNAPPGFLLCQGQAVSRTTYDALFAVIGTAYGAGDESTTFNLPDFRGRYPMGVATSGEGNSVGATFGSKNHTHSIPAHTHSTPNHSHSIGNTGSGGSHTHSQGNTGQSSGHFHNVGNTSTAGSHSHSTGQGGATSPSVAQGALGNAGPSHTHSVSSGGSHSHTVADTSGESGHTHTNPNTNSGGSHSPSNPNTNSGGASTTGSGGSGTTGSNNPPTLTTNFIISY